MPSAIVPARRSSQLFVFATCFAHVGLSQLLGGCLLVHSWQGRRYSIASSGVEGGGGRGDGDGDGDGGSGGGAGDGSAEQLVEVQPSLLLKLQPVDLQSFVSS